MKLKAIAFAASLSLLAASAFAADVDLTDTGTWGNDTTTDLDLPTFQAAAMPLAVDPSGLTGNVGLVMQLGDGNLAVIDQYGGAQNFASIAQDSLNSVGAVPNEGAVYQEGNLNGASVYQH